MLELIGVQKKFAAVKVIKCISFTLQPGKIVGYLGPNGAGKTTTLNMAAGLLNPTEGRILYNGTPIFNHPDLHRRRIGYLQEHSELFPFLSGYETLEMFARLRGIAGKGLRERIEAMLTSVDLSDSAHYPVSQYSKGMRQKVLLLASMIHDPEILFLDEPMSGLDVFSISVFREMLKLQASRNRIILYSTHQLNTVIELCDRVLVLHKGLIHFDIPSSELKLALAGKGLDTLFQQEIFDRDSRDVAREIMTGIITGS
ncbi:MAG: ABC transporter ATP-binding protein [Acidobacteriota bacterium]|jgi:ABC-2 type transport system ATP-binding protein|nr:ABC transporter ATP-binding protein [Acidobacteriota bacterium]